MISVVMERKNENIQCLFIQGDDMRLYEILSDRVTRLMNLKTDSISQYTMAIKFLLMTILNSEKLTYDETSLSRG